ncbi:MAG: DUF748 domain-containing protein [Pseudobdellovibrionaceae bacterium]
MARNPKKVIGLTVLVLLFTALIAGRLYLPYWLKDYVNETLDNIDGYSGSVKDIDVHLYRGAYQIYGLTIYKDGVAKVTPPFVAVDMSDLSIQWAALFHGKVVAEADLYGPRINFVTYKGQPVQTGTDTDWTKPIKELMPVDFNRVGIHNGRVDYKDFFTSPDIDIFIADMQGTVTNLRNVEDKYAALPSTFTLRGNSIGGGSFATDGHLNALKATPDFDLNAKLEHVDLTAFNKLSNAAIGVDFTKGNLDVYVELAAKDGQVTGYIKPLIRNMSMIDMAEQDTNPLDVIWESIVSLFAETLENQSQDQFATRIELSGDLNDPDTSGFWTTLANIFKNAFVQAFSRDTDGTVRFFENREEGQSAP